MRQNDTVRRKPSSERESSGIKTETHRLLHDFVSQNSECFKTFRKLYCKYITYYMMPSASLRTLSNQRR